MKKFSLFVVCLVSISAQSKEIPSPFWYSISEKILTGTKNLIQPSDVPARPAKKTVKTVKPVRLPLRCEQKKDTITLTPFVTIKPNGRWMEAE